MVKYQINPGWNKLQMTMAIPKKRNKEEKKALMVDMYVTDGTWLRQAKTKHRILKHLNQGIIEFENV
jgi:hypothetical protein